MTTKAHDSEKFVLNLAKRLEKSSLKDMISKNFATHDEMRDYCSIALEKLSMHPISPEPDFVVDELRNEVINEVEKVMLEEWKSIQLDDYELEDLLKDIGELEDDSSPCINNPAKPGKFKKLRTYFGKRKDRATETAEPLEEPLEESNGWGMVRKVHQKLGHEYDKFKGNFKKSEEDEEPPSSGCRMSTPVSQNASAIEEMIRQIHIMQFQNKYYRRQIEKARSDLMVLALYKTVRADKQMDKESTEIMREAMHKLDTFAANCHYVFTELNNSLNHNEIFMDCTKRYEEKQLSQAKTSKGFFGKFFGRSKRDKSAKKGKRKSEAKEDEKQLLEDPTPSPSPSPKRAKEEADEEVIRRLRKTSVTDDDDDDIQDVLL